MFPRRKLRIVRAMLALMNKLQACSGLFLIGDEIVRQALCKKLREKYE
jgi:hypothetical protein